MCVRICKALSSYRWLVLTQNSVFLYRSNEDATHRTLIFESLQEYILSCRTYIRASSIIRYRWCEIYFMIKSYLHVVKQSRRCRNILIL